MKATLLPLFIILISSFQVAEAQTWSWARGASASSQGDAFKTGMDAAGNVYIAGNYSGASITWGSTTLSGGGVYVCKMDTSGNVLWAQTCTGNTTCGISGMATDPEGNTYIGGYFDGSSITFGSYTLHSTGTWHSYLAKYDASGNVAWAVDGGGNGNQVQAIALNPNGNVYICGIYQNTTCTIGSTTLQSDGDNDSYIAELDANGNGLWATRVAGTSWDDVYGIAADECGNSYISGYSGSSVLNFGTTISLNNTAYGIFIGKFDSHGNPVWANNTTGSGYNFVTTMAADYAGNTYVTGYVDGTTDFGNSVSLSNATAGYFLVKYDATGNAVWINSIAEGGGMGNEVATDAAGNIYAAGYFSGASATFGGTTLSSSQAQTCFLAKYDSSGHVDFAIHPGGDAGTNGNGEGIAIDKYGNITLSGTFYNGSITFGTTTLTNNGSWDPFVARVTTGPIGSRTVTVSVPTITAGGPTSFCQGDSVILTSSAAANYFWNNTDTSKSITVKTSGSYTVMVSNASGCSATSLPTAVAVVSSVTAGNITGMDSVCSGATVALKDSGSGAQNWQWQSSSSANNFTNISGATDSVYGSTVQQTTYFRAYVGSGACTDTTPVFKLVAAPIPAPGVTATDTAFCHGDSSRVCTGSDFTSYLWNTTDTTYCITVSTAGSYSVRVTDANGCTAISQRVAVSVHPAPVDSVTTDKPIFCPGDTALVCSSGPFTRYQWNTTDTGACLAATAAGNYYLTVTDANGCTAESNHLAIAVYPVPSVAIIRQGDTLSSFGQSSYQWIRNNVPIDSATGFLYIARQSGSYAVQVTDTNGCTTTSEAVLVTTGLQTLQQEDGIFVYPNPSSAGNWQLTAGNELIGADLDVYDEQGRLVFHSAISNQNSTLSLEVPSGIYYLRLTNENVHLVKKLVKL